MKHKVNTAVLRNEFIKLKLKATNYIEQNFKTEYETFEPHKR